jgi:hypothetical protein
MSFDLVDRLEEQLRCPSSLLNLLAGASDLGLDPILLQPWNRPFCAQPTSGSSLPLLNPPAARVAQPTSGFLLPAALHNLLAVCFCQRCCTTY